MTTTGKRSRDWVELHVGGTARFSTTVTTLSASSHYFSAKFSGDWSQESDSVLYLDRDAAPFEVLLSCMRSRTVALLPTDECMFKRVLLEAEFFGVDFVLNHVKAKAAQNINLRQHSKVEHNPLVERVKFGTGGDSNKIGSDADVALRYFNQKWPALEDAFKAGVLPARYFAPTALARADIVKVIPAPATARVVFMDGRGNEKDRKRPVAYALVKRAGRKGRFSFFGDELPAGNYLEPIISVRPKEGRPKEGHEYTWDSEYGPDESLYLATEYAGHRIDYTRDEWERASWLVTHENQGEEDRGEEDEEDE